MTVRGFGVAAALLVSLALLTAGPASAGWHYTFKNFIKTSKTTTSAGLTEVSRCARGLAGDWRLRSRMEVEVTSSTKPKYQSVELEVKAKMPITTKFKSVHDVDVRWEAKLPDDPSAAALMTEHYERLAQGQSDFYEGMSVRWRPAKQKLDVLHNGLAYGEYPQLAPGEFTTTFKPKPGC